MESDGDVNYHIDGIGLSYGSPVVCWLRSPVTDFDLAYYVGSIGDVVDSVDNVGYSYGSLRVIVVFLVYGL